MPDDASQGLLWRYRGPVQRSMIMPISPYEGGKQRKHFTLSETAFAHLSRLASSAMLSRSETLERLIRSTPLFEGSATLSNNAWPACIDHSSSPHETV